MACKTCFDIVVFKNHIGFHVTSKPMILHSVFFVIDSIDSILQSCDKGEDKDVLSFPGFFNGLLEQFFVSFLVVDGFKTSAVFIDLK